MKFLIFDFDGVIVNTFPMTFRIMRELRAGDLTETEYRDYFNGNVYQKLDASVGGTDDRLMEPTPFFLAYGPELLETEPVEGMADLLKQFHAEGISMAIVSSTMDDLIHKFLVRYELASCFQQIYGASTHKQKTVKLDMVLKAVGRSADEALFITDTVGDVREALSVGIPSIAVTWGYHPVETLQQSDPLAIVHTVDELRDVLEDA